MITMFQADIAFSLGLIALTAGMALIVWMSLHVEHTSKFCRGLGYLIVLLAIFTLVCTGYYTIRYWSEGYFSPQRVGQHYQMKQRMMKKCMKMQEMMKNMDMKKMPMMNMQQGTMQDKSMMDKNAKTMPMQNMQKTKNVPISEVKQEEHHK